MVPTTKADQRHAERIDVDGDIRLRVYLTRRDDVQEVRAHLVNVSAGGLCIDRTDADLPLGALADLELWLEGAPLANTLALIRWIKPGRAAGLEFFYATDEERTAFLYYLELWRRKRSEPRRLPSSLDL